MLTEIDPAKVEEAADAIYARGFRDGVKWANAGVRAKVRELDRLMTRSERRTERVPDTTSPLPEQGSRKA